MNAFTGERCLLCRRLHKLKISPKECTEKKKAEQFILEIAYLKQSNTT